MLNTEYFKKWIKSSWKAAKKSRDELKEITRLRRIKNRDKLKKEGLIISLLKWESSDAEHNYMKHFNNNTMMIMIFIMVK